MIIGKKEQFNLKIIEINTFVTVPIKENIFLAIIISNIFQKTFLLKV